jgi:hypothetical protein|tara:strand:+ start:366 stop:821 length:456 start_codon:yes stop_codon:yes gene_type:complete
MTALLWTVAKGIASLMWILVKGIASLSWVAAKLLLGAIRLVRGGVGRGAGRRTAVRVRRQWNDHRIGVVRWSDLKSPRWDTVSGGTLARSPQPFIHSYVMCDRVRGDIAHSCAHGPGPHKIKVCLVKKDNTKEVWERMLELAGPRPAKRFW